MTERTTTEISAVRESTDRRPSVTEVATAGSAVLDAVNTAVVGLRETLRLALATVLAGGHVLF